MGDVISLGLEVVGDGVRVAPNDVLNSAVGKLSDVLIVGTDENGELYIAASDGIEHSVYLLECAKLELLA